MNNLIKVKCIHYSHDWIDIKEVEINLDEYVFFEIDYRGDNSWHIIGHKCDKDYNWTSTELSVHCVLGIREVAKFIAYANIYPQSKGKFQECKVSRFNNLHYYGKFYKALEELFKLVETENTVLLNQIEKNEIPFMVE